MRSRHLLEDLSLAAPEGIRIGVLVQDRPEYLAPCLASLRASTERASLKPEVHLFDDGSTDERTQGLLREHTGGRLGWRLHSRSPGGGDWGRAHRWALATIAAGASPGVLVGTIDSDVVLQPNWIDPFVEWCRAVRQLGESSPTFFSALNSSDLAFHAPVQLRWAGTTPYLLRRRMGGAHLFAFAADLGRLGPFPTSWSVGGRVIPGFDDESIMTRRMRRRRLANASMVSSLVEHIGQASVLNARRHLPVPSAVYGLNQPSADWAVPYGVSPDTTAGLLQQEEWPTVPEGDEQPVRVAVVGAEPADCVAAIRRNYLDRIIGEPMVIDGAGWLDSALEIAAESDDSDTLVVRSICLALRPFSLRRNGHPVALVRERKAEDPQYMLSLGRTRAVAWWAPFDGCQLWTAPAARAALSGGHSDLIRAFDALGTRDKWMPRYAFAVPETHRDARRAISLGALFAVRGWNGPDPPWLQAALMCGTTTYPRSWVPPAST